MYLRYNFTNLGPEETLDLLKRSIRILNLEATMNGWR